MVKDNKFGIPRNKRLKRKGSWKDTIRGLTSVGEKRKELPPSRYLTSSLRSPARRHLRPHRKEQDATDGEGELADAESDEEDEDFNYRKEEDRPISARIRYAYPHTMTPPNQVLSELMTKKQQQELSAAVEEADSQVSMAGSSRKGKEPIGTRLTMTSRTGYFQDRIVSPSMVQLGPTARLS